MNTKRILSVLFFAFAFAAIPLIGNAQTMNLTINDGSTPQTGEHYYIQIEYVEVLNNGIVVNTISIASGANQDLGDALTIYNNSGQTDCSFTANVPYDVTAKIYRVKFRIIRDDPPPASPYNAAATGYSEECNSDMFYAVGGFNATCDL